MLALGAALAIVLTLFMPTSADAATSTVVKPGSTVVIPGTSSAGLDGTIRAEVRIDALPTSGSLYATLATRSSAEGQYQTQLRVYPSGSAYLSLKRAEKSGKSTTYTALGSPVRVSGVVKNGTAVTVSTTVSGGATPKLSVAARVGSGTTASFSVTDKSEARLSDDGSTRGSLYVGSGGRAYKVTPLAVSAAFTPSTPPVKPVEPTPPTEPTPPIEPTSPVKPVEPTPPTEPTPTPTPDPVPPTVPTAPVTPDASSTGVPAGTVLTIHEGDLVVREANAVIDGLEVRGAIVVEAPGVVIRNSKIVGGVKARSTGLVSNVVSKQPFTIVDSEIYAAHRDPLWVGIFGSNFTAERVNVHGVVDPIHVTGDNVVVRDSWLHDNDHWEQDSLWNGKPSHDDSIQIVAGSSIVIEGNRLEGAHNAAIQISQNTSLPTLGSIKIRDNFLQGGACTVNVAPTPGAVNPEITSNTFGPERMHQTCAVIAPKANAPVLSGNIWATNGSAMSDFVVVQ